MPTLTVNLAETYSLSLEESKATPVDWGQIGKNKLRRFFVHPNWDDYIARVSVSSGGMKGGVFFLEAYEVTPAAFEQNLKALNVTIDASEAWKRLHADNHLAGGIIIDGKAFALGTPAVVKPQVLQGPFTLTDAFYGKSAPARKILLTALRKATKLRKRYVVKGTNEPGRTLFAEYVLNTIGRAKIPKSLVLEIDPSRPHTDADPSEGMIMLNLIDTRRSGTDADRYTAAYANLHNGAQSVVDYLVVQKLIAGDMLADPEEMRGRVVEFLCDQKIIVDVRSFETDDNFADDSPDTLFFMVRELGEILGCLRDGLVVPDYEARLNGLQTLEDKKDQIKAVLAAALPTLGANNLDRPNYQKNPPAQFDQLVADLQGKDTPLATALADFLATLRPIISTNKKILSNVIMLKNIAGVHFADALVGNGDRFHRYNTGNMFFVWRLKPTKTGKASNPVGCIDNDAFLYTYSDAKTNFKSVKDYVAKVLKPNYELWGWNSPEPQGAVWAPNMSLLDVLDSDSWFDSTDGIFHQIIRDDWPVAVLDLYGDDFFMRNEPDVQGLPGWVRVRQTLREGVAQALTRYLRTDIRQYRAVYQALTGRYYPGPNFEFTAFEIRDRYLRECQVNEQDSTILLPSLAAFQAEIVAWLKETRTINPECDNPQVSPIAERALSAAGRLNRQVDGANIRRLLKTMAVSDQERLLPNPFGIGPIPTDDKKWAKLKQAYLDRMDVVICTLLQRFWDEYIAEVGYLTHDRKRVLRSKAFESAEKLSEQVSSAKLAKDQLDTQNIRTQVLHQLDLVDYVFVK